MTQSRRLSTKYYDFYQFHMENEGLNKTTITKYNETDAAIIAKFLEKYDQAHHKEGKCLAQTYSLEK